MRQLKQIGAFKMLLLFFYFMILLIIIATLAQLARAAVL
jgi:hypothetical protein